MAGPERWDKRRSGRTRGMLAAAMRQCFGGRHVYVVVARMTMFTYCVPILQDMGATRIRNQQHSVEFGVGCELHFVDVASPMRIKGSFELQGVHPENVFWDHEAVRQIHNQILQRYHEYD